jgi:hypothetical protein
MRGTTSGMPLASGTSRSGLLIIGRATVLGFSDMSSLPASALTWSASGRLGIARSNGGSRTEKKRLNSVRSVRLGKDVVFTTLILLLDNAR